MVKYVVQKYTKYPIYEPAEGGYYYEGIEPEDHPWAICNTKEEAVLRLRELVKSENEQLGDFDESQKETLKGFVLINPSGLYAHSINHKYIGDGFEYHVEPINRRGRKRRGRVPYC